MRYYILTTTKFAKECVENGIYGSTNSNWLSNIEIDDYIFISQFNYKSQIIYGPFRVSESLFYDKNIIYPNQKYYYRIKFNNNFPKFIEETDLYLKGIKDKKVNFSFRIINLIQQNKHLHSICLNNIEGQFISDTFKDFGRRYKTKGQKAWTQNSEKFKVNLNFLSNKNKLLKKLFFSSESDLETFIILNLKNKNNLVCKQLYKILDHFHNNDLHSSEIYNRFIFGNAYPSDIVIINKNNINIFELKKDILNQNSLFTIEKEIKKYCYYSLFSDRVQNNEIKQVNFFLLILGGNNHGLKDNLNKKFNEIVRPIINFRKYNFSILEYYIKDNQIFFKKL
jgi:hypothetical protein